MKDFIGNKLELGSQVVLLKTGSRDFEKGMIIKIGPKKLTIQLGNRIRVRRDGTYSNKTIRWPENVIKIK